MIVNNIILTADVKVSEELKLAGFRFIKEENGIFQFMIDNSIKFNFAHYGKKIMRTNKMTF